MPVLALVSAKGAPGVTVCAAALVAATRNPAAPRAGAVLVEFDPAGGDLPEYVACAKELDGLVARLAERIEV